MFVERSLFPLFYLQSSLFIICLKIGQEIAMCFSNEINCAFFLRLPITTEICGTAVFPPAHIYVLCVVFFFLKFLNL